MSDPRSTNSRLAGPRTCRWCGTEFDVPVGMDVIYEWPYPDPRERFRAWAENDWAENASRLLLHECAHGVPVEQAAR